MRASLALVGLLAVLACKSSKPEPRSQALEFRLRGKAVQTLTLNQLTARLRPQRVQVYEPYELSEATFVAFEFAAVLDQAFGPIWRNQEDILFTCLDGYRPVVPVRRVLEHRAWLAFDRAGDMGFSILKPESGTRRRVNLAPFYLIWDNLEDPRIRAEQDYGWPYQLTSIDLIEFRVGFARMAPPADAGESVQRGFEAFRIHCMQCHAINGQGGHVGPELNYPANPTEYMRSEWLHKWIDDPSNVRLAPRMPPLNPQLPHREAAIQDIVAYLTAVAPHKLNPSGAAP